MKTRRAARAVLVDPQQRVLLFQYEDDDIFNPINPINEPFWVMPGGGLELGESFEDAVVREIWEETGYRPASLSDCIWTREILLNWRGELINHHERFFLAEVDLKKVDLKNLGDEEEANFLDFRWWSYEEMLSTSDVLLPRGLSQLIAPLLEGKLPETPIKLTK